MRRALIETLEGIQKIKNYVEDNKGVGEELCLFSFTDEPGIIDDLINDLKEANYLINQLED